MAVRYLTMLGLSLTLAGIPLADSEEAVPPDCLNAPEVCLDSLEDISIAALRSRSYQSRVTLLQETERRPGQRTFLAGYTSDGLALYTRVDLPVSPPPAAGYPLIVMAPGWISRAEALDWDFGVDGKSVYSKPIDAFVARGFTVLTVGYRGRGQVGGARAEGMVFRDAWGNGSYISPLFYAIDVLNLLAGLPSLAVIPWQQWLPAAGTPPAFNLDKVSLWGHSQGGDVVLTALAVSGHNPEFPQPVMAASIWSGNIPDRFTQADTFAPMSSSTQAFLSGDGSWTGSAVGKNGELNPDFVFPWPADWIATLDTESEDWTWQAGQWSIATVAQARQGKYQEMYDTLNRYVKNLEGLKFSMARDADGKSYVRHAPAVAAIVPTLGGYNSPQHIEATLALHISDRDFYSLPAWNHDLALRINERGGQARVYTYTGNTHALRRSGYSWFSPDGTVDGAPLALARDTLLFSGAGLAD